MAVPLAMVLAMVVAAAMAGPKLWGALVTGGRWESWWFSRQVKGKGGGGRRERMEVQMGSRNKSLALWQAMAWMVSSLAPAARRKPRREATAGGKGLLPGWASKQVP